MPRGYGGVAIIWQQQIDSLGKPLDDGKERIQLIEVGKNNTKLLIASVYLPSTCGKNHQEEFFDTIDQLYEIWSKYKSSHTIILGGDPNIDLGNNEQNGKRKDYLLKFIKDCNLKYNCRSKTFVKSNGEECSELDYFLTASAKEISNKSVLSNIYCNTSDHHPIKISLKIEIGEKNTTDVSYTNTNTVKRINWEKVDMDLYKAMVADKTENRVDYNLKDEEQLAKVLTNICEIMKESAEECSPNKPVLKAKAKPKLKIWNADIKDAVKETRKGYDNWLKAGKPLDPRNRIYQTRQQTRKEFRRYIRIELAKRKEADKEKIMAIRNKDMRMFHMLVQNNRNKGKKFIMDLNVGGETFSGHDNILDGFKQHFKQLSKYDDMASQYDANYHNTVEMEVDIIENLVHKNKIQMVSANELKNAINAVNKRKSPDIYGITIEHIINANKETFPILSEIINQIFTTGNIPDILKVGLITPIFKKKGCKNDSANYRGITVLPVLNKIVEAVLKQRIKDNIIQHQCRSQRGFTHGSSPLNAALPIEEMYREMKDRKLEFDLVLLDAKSAFDVVVHKHLLRRTYHAGIDNTHWLLINSMYMDAKSAVKWDGKISDTFPVDQGVRQGGILSADLYKLYVNPLLKTMEESNIGCKIGNINSNITARADDIALMSASDIDMQVQINMANDFAGKEGYKLQPRKSVAIHVKPGKSKEDRTSSFQLGNVDMPNVESATHLGILRTNTLEQNISQNVEENITKARRSAYALFGTGFHGENGLDAETLIHLYRTYVLPVLLYGMELLIPRTCNLDKVEKFQKKMLKQLLSVPVNTPDPAVYILTGILPIEGQIHIKALTFFNNICNQSEESMEKQIAKRQLEVKTSKSNSWFIEIQKLLFKYNLGSAKEQLDKPLNKQQWNKVVKNETMKYWINEITSAVPLYSGLDYLSYKQFQPGKIHPLLKLSVRSYRDVTRFPVKIKMLTGTYILQTTRFKFDHTVTSAQCPACENADESLEHFILNCPSWITIRQNVIQSITKILDEKSDIEWQDLQTNMKMQILLDITKVLKHLKIDEEAGSEIEFHTRRLLYLMHTARCKLMDSKAVVKKPP